MSEEFPIIIKLGGAKAVAEHLRARQAITAARTVGMWRTRGQISATGMLALMEIAESMNVTYCSRDFVKARRNEFEGHSTGQREGVAA